MAEYDRQTLNARAGSALAIDEGLRSYMLRVYNYMGLGLVVTGLVAFFTSQWAMSSQANAELLYGSPLSWVIMLSPLAFVLVLSFGINKLSKTTAQLLFWLFAGAMGLSLTNIFLVFTGESIARVFFITAGMFAATSLYGYTTKRDLARMGSFMFMGLIGIIIAMVVNIFVGSSALQFAISVIGVIVFTGLTAWDTQRIKELYTQLDGSEIAGKKALMGALSLYLNFINMFVMLMQLFGTQRD